MYAAEFKTKIKNGMIIIPEKYRESLNKNVKVIVLSEEKESNTADMIDNLLNTPLKINNFEPLNREEIYERS